MSEHHRIDLVEFPAASEDALRLTQEFFSNVFGWKYTEYGNVYSDTRDSGVTSGINSAEPGKSSMPLAVIYSENLEATREKVIASGGTIIADIYAFPGGRRFHFTEPGGNELAVWSE